jgi:HPt (histidine-containing phosphotransfer) domain-containing protein
MLAHSLAGSLSNFGAQRLTAEARRLESAAAASDLHDAQQLAESMRLESQRVMAALRDELGDEARSALDPERKPSAEEAAAP